MFCSSHFQSVEKNKEALSDELNRLKSLEKQFENVSAEKEEILMQKSILQSECSVLAENQKSLLKEIESLKVELMNKDSQNDQSSNQIIDVS